MCVYICAKGQQIQLDYVSESIEFSNDSTEENILDILLTNHSDSPINQVIVLYPHPFCYKGNKVFSGEIRDITETYCEKSVYNRIYNAPGSSLDKFSTGDPAEVKLTITQPDPNDPIHDRKVNGIISGEHTITPWNIGTVGWDILSEMGWAVFVCKFNQPIQPQQARWMRWLIGPGDATEWNKMPRWQRLYRIMLDSLSYHYEVIGPLDVHHRFWEGLLAYKRECSEPHAKQKKNITQTTNLIAEAEKVIEYPIKSSPSTRFSGLPPLRIMDWRVNIFAPSRFKILPPIRTGDIRVCGAAPNTIKSIGCDPTPCYQWVGGEDHIRQRHSGRFGLVLDVEYVSLIPRLVQWIALVVAIASLVACC
jgi:hypothetical protein